MRNTIGKLAAVVLTAALLSGTTNSTAAFAGSAGAILPGAVLTDAGNMDAPGAEITDGEESLIFEENTDAEEVPGAGEVIDADEIAGGDDAVDAGEINGASDALDAGDAIEGGATSEGGAVTDAGTSESEAADPVDNTEVEADGNTVLSENDDPEGGDVELKSIEEAAVDDIADVEYNGKAHTPEVIVTLTDEGEDKVLTEGTDYTLSYKNNTKAGTASAVITGAGEYTGTITKTFTIKAVSLYSVTLKYSSLQYTGSPRTQSGTTVVKAKVGESYKVLKGGTDYSIEYSSNSNIGTAKMTVTGKGNFKGKITKSFKIIPPGSKITAVTAGTKKASLKWSKQPAKTDGYQVQCSLKKDFSSGVKSKKIAGYKHLKTDVTGLTAGKTYYFRIRTYKAASDGKTYYSKWSGLKSVKLKYNAISVKGSGDARTIVFDNPKSSVKSVRAAVWSKTGGQDDIKWYNFKKNSDGSYSAKVYAVHLKHSGTVVAHVYINRDTFSGARTFKVTRAEYDSTINTIKMSGSGAKKTIMILRPHSTAKSYKAAFWTITGGQDDIKWVKLKKASDGTWKGTVDTAMLFRNGRAVAHVDQNDNTFIGETKFNVNAVTFPVCETEKEYIDRIAPKVQRVCKKYGYLPSVLIGQSCLENGYGIPDYWDNPGVAALIRYNNMIGMKSELLNSSWYDKTVWPGKSLTKRTPEEINGQHVIITDDFRIYDDPEQSFADFLLFLTYASNYGHGGTPKYGKAVINIKDPNTLITNVANRGYATDSSYASTVMRIINKHGLTKYDDLTNVKETIY